MVQLGPDRAFIFRITHIANLEWTLAHGLHCRSSNQRDPQYREIGNPDLIAKRVSRIVPIPPDGSLSDYIPFYFTPYSPMLLNIKTGYGGIQQVPLNDIVILVTSLRQLADRSIPFVFTDRHAYMQTARFYNDLAHLEEIDWGILQNRDFKRDPSDPGKIERYQAEALVHRHLPCDALMAVICRSQAATNGAESLVSSSGLEVKVLLRPGFYL